MNTPEEKQRILAHDIQITLDPMKHRLEAHDRLAIKKGNGKFRAFINKGLDIDSIRKNGQIVNFKKTSAYRINDFVKDARSREREHYKNAAIIEIDIPKDPCEQEVDLDISYKGVIYDELKVPSFSREYIADQTTGIISKEGIYLSGASHWYLNLPDDLASYRLTAITPSPYEVITEGERLERTEAYGKIRTIWNITHPLDSLHLIAGRYQITEEKYKKTRIYTFFFPEEAHLVPLYFKAVKKYLGIYENLLGEYPYSKFAVIENFFPSGYGEPSFTLLGQEVLKLPFIIDTSLGHEIAHNWWGNSVLVDFKKGNWCEGLTTYTADYLYKKLRGENEAIDYRRQINSDYSNYVHEKNDLPLLRFVERTTPATRAIGYGKSAMVFHMLHRMIGEESFYGALRLLINRKIFERTSWEDLRHSFEEVSGEKLDWFFTQWIERKGAPFIKLGQIDCEKEDDSYKLCVEILQEGEPYILDAPLKVLLSSGEVIEENLRMKDSKEIIHLVVKSKPKMLVVDPEYDVFRRLHRKEMTPVLSQVLGDKDQLVIAPTKGSSEKREAYLRVAQQLTRSGDAVLKYDSEVENRELVENSLFILGGKGENILFDKFIDNLPKHVSIGKQSFTLNDRFYDQEDSSLLLTIRNSYNQNKSSTILYALSPGAVSNIKRKIMHYGKYSYLVFVDGKNVDKGIWKIEVNPLMHRF